MLRNPKDKDLNLSGEELKRYYDCYSHHHFNRHNCTKSLDSGNRTISSRMQCPCCPDSFDEAHLNHFCTGYSFDLSAITDDLSHTNHDLNCTHSDLQHSLILCENFRPSFTSKRDQIDFLKRDIKLVRTSKNILKKTIEDLDRVLDEFKEKSDEDGLNEVEKFYRSKKFIGSSMKIKSFKNCLPRKDIKPGKFIIETKNKIANSPDFGSAIFSLKDKNIFVDSDILENEKIKIKKPDIKVRAKSAIISMRPK